MVVSRKCCVDGCDNDFYRNVGGKPYCSKHRTQMVRHGKILEETIYDKNKINTYDEYATVVVKIKDEKIEALIDIEDIDLIKDYKWHGSKHSNGYYIATGGSTSTNRMYLHTLIVGNKQGYDIDHINGNTLDNRKCNLRFIPHSDNGSNRTYQSNNKLKHKNICYDKSRNKYSVQIKYKDKSFKKRYNTLDEAIEARNNIYKEWNIPCERELD